ncbi:MAG: glutamine-hydrolyzing carbamoyl-phosphate synthase small subunit [Bacteriovoracaceae bacterium]|nr:glutamine-hydrolyzing carbamoyl-phosphate synthase small subunit [Bacteriovoracaceae bacterium]
MKVVDGTLILDNGKTFQGKIWKGDHFTQKEWMGEVVFNTSMVGYQEMLTDPSYNQQILCLTFPVIGVYGTNKNWSESIKAHARALIVHDLYFNGGEEYQRPSLLDFASKQQIPVMSDIDTRALVLELRKSGTRKGIIVETLAPQSSAKTKILEWAPRDHVQEVSVSRMIRMHGNGNKNSRDPKYRIAVYDFGVKSHIMESLKERGHEVIQVPYNTSKEDILDLEIDGLVLSNGPGDPTDLKEHLPTYKFLAEKFPTLGICLGHQILCLAFGAKTYKLSFGHRGGNHPVRQIDNGRVFLTSQNHGYAVDRKSLDVTDLIVTYESLNDFTVEGVKHKFLPIMSVQYHPEHNPGPRDSEFHFDQFLQMVGKK